jgi:predicted transcriptional regulator
MTTLTIQLSDDTVQRLRALASARGISLDRLLEEVSEAALTAHDTEARFNAMAAKGERDAALEVLARLDRNERC